MEMTIVFVYMAILMVVTVLSARSAQLSAPPVVQQDSKKKKKEPTVPMKEVRFADYFKTALRGGVFFSLLMGLFTFYYYARVDVDFFDVKFDETVSSYEEYFIEERDKYESNPTEEAEQTFAQVKENYKNMVVLARFMYTSKQQAFYTFLGLICLSLLYASVVAVVYRKVISRKKFVPQ